MKKNKFTQDTIDEEYSSENEEEIKPKTKVKSCKTIPQKSESQTKKAFEAHFIFGF